jgi:hypothetical protein
LALVFGAESRPDPASPRPVTTTYRIR